MEGEVEALEVGEDPVAEHGLGPAGLTEREPPPEPAADAGDDAGDEDRERPLEQGAVAAVTDPTVDGHRDQGRNRHLGRRPGQTSDDSGGQAPPLVSQLGAHEAPTRAAGLRVFL